MARDPMLENERQRVEHLRDRAVRALETIARMAAEEAARIRDGGEGWPTNLTGLLVQAIEDVGAARQGAQILALLDALEERS